MPAVSLLHPSQRPGTRDNGDWEPYNREGGVMSVSIGGVAKGRDGQAVTADWAEAGYEVHDRAWRRMALWLAVILVLGSVGLLFSPPSVPAPRTVFGVGPGLRLRWQLAGQHLRPRFG